MNGKDKMMGTIKLKGWAEMPLRVWQEYMAAKAALDRATAAHARAVAAMAEFDERG
jgi:hypothetical protein